MSFFDDASLAFLPSGAAGKDGKAYSIKPVPEYGDEKVTNGDFATDSDWTKGTGWTISGGKANSDGTQSVSYLRQNGIVNLTSIYKIKFVVSNRVSGTLKLIKGNGGSAVNVTNNGEYEFTSAWDGSSGDIVFQSLNFVGSIDNVSVKEVITADGDFTFSRGSNLAATRVDVNGLIEKGRENLLKQSNNFGTTWVTNSASVTSGQADKDGGSTAWKLQKSGANGRIYQSVTSSGVHTFSVYAKAADDNWAYLVIGSSAVAWFDLANGAIGTKSSEIDAEIKSCGNGWFRLSLTFNQNNPQVRIYPADGNNDTSGSSGSIYIQDAQLEQGLVATDYIETGTSAAQSGILEDMPRLDYSGSCPSLLLEPQRSNLITNSEYINGISWNGKIGVSFDTNTTTSPEGLENSALLKEDSSNGSHFAYKDFSLTSGSTYTISIFAKSNGTNRNLRFGDGGVGWSSGFNGVFNLTNGTATGGTIEPMGSGWYRCSVTGTTNATTSRLIIYALLNTATTYQGNGSSGLFLYGFQVEAASYPTSYIPNHSGGSVTRGADVCNSAGDSSTFNDSEGVLYAEVAALANDGTNRRIVISDGTFNNNVQLYYYPASNRVRTLVNSGGITSIDATAGLSDLTIYHKFAIRYKTNDFSLWVDGVQVATDTSGNTPSGLNQLNFNDAGGSNFYGNVKQVLTFNTALSDADLTTLTTL